MGIIWHGVVVYIMGFLCHAHALYIVGIICPVFSCTMYYVGIIWALYVIPLGIMVSFLG